MSVQFSEPVSVFHDRRLPEAAAPAGYAALIGAYNLPVPVPRLLCAIGSKHRVIEQDGWRIYTPRHAPDASLEGHLTFALKYEGLDLAVLKRLFLAVKEGDIAELVRQKPTGLYTRRLWFLYEWLLGRELQLPSADKVSYVDAVDTDLQFGGTGQNSARHRVRNNLPGTPEFCPLVFKTPALNDFIAQDWNARARAVIREVPKDLLARTAAFLLLKDSKSSYVIEGERPPQDRIQRWGRAIGEAGRAPLDEQEFLRLQGIVIGDERFVKMGFRKEGGFVGEHDRDTQRPIPDHISARHEDVPSLMAGLIAFDHSAENDLDPVVAAAVLAFGFVYIHPFEDGNGRIHRYLMHHVLARRDFNPPGLHFPVSSAILDRITEYKDVLESYSSRLLPCVQWEATPKGNVKVLNDTGDFYRYFDATPHAEFLYGCVRQTIEQDLPNETNFLRSFDAFRAGIENMIDMPERTLNNLFGFLRQNDGKLSKRARENEFAELTADEVEQIEELYQSSFSAKGGGDATA
ncbi:Fic family protein [Bradyrhizobium arachidis]|uniref:Fic family protein n=1 Tax=Bradyrhizobium arachidis TaxID=858423 RepID=A0AAE7NQ14_9BRAD|nr:Fic family protein [Bradyrhizobium arachidis]QOZ66559.1 Fic family protein [Bradyrhizobium arachidis]SFV19636.1 Fic/DOC family protein [Bradyrhizobium arachidis]